MLGCQDCKGWLRWMHNSLWIMMSVVGIVLTGCSPMTGGDGLSACQGRDGADQGGRSGFSLASDKIPTLSGCHDSAGLFY